MLVGLQVQCSWFDSSTELDVLAERNNKTQCVFSLRGVFYISKTCRFESCTRREHSKLVRFEVESQQRGVLYPLLLAKRFWVNIRLNRLMNRPPADW